MTTQEVREDQEGYKFSSELPDLPVFLAMQRTENWRILPLRYPQKFMRIADCHPILEWV